MYEVKRIIGILHTFKNKLNRVTEFDEDKLFQCARR